MSLNEEIYEAYLNSNELDREKLISKLLNTSETKSIINAQLKKYRTFKDIEDDLIQAANVGVFEGIVNYDKSLNIPFNAYISQCVNFSILNTINSLNKSLKSGRGTSIKIQILKRLMSEYPNDEAKVRALFKEKTGIEKDSTIDDYFRYVSQDESMIRLDSNIKDDTTLERIDVCTSTELDPEEILMRDSLSETLMDYFDRFLTENEKKFVMNYIGFDTKRLSISEIAEKYNVSKQYVSKSIKNSLEKIKKNNQLLKDLVQLNSSRGK